MSEASIVPGPSAAGVDLTGRSALVTGAASGASEASYINGAYLVRDGGWTAR